MEYIPPPAVTLQTWISPVSCQHCGFEGYEAISWLTSSSLPENANIGPVGGGTIVHRFWALDGQWRAPLDFTSVAALECYVNRALALYVDPEIDGPPQVIKLTNLPLQFCHSGVTYDNFLIDPDTLELSLIDAGFIAILPLPFLEFALTLNRFTEAVLEQIMEIPVTSTVKRIWPRLKQATIDTYSP
ncbi:hypothetical protein H0H92_009966 [Tricholoma furcatifolium]|nr:hypothetical protein H0H92_009966 [Tricholoma furcatifolium]